MYSYRSGGQGLAIGHGGPAVHNLKFVDDFSTGTVPDENVWRWYYPVAGVDGSQDLTTSPLYWDGDPPWNPGGGADQTAGLVKSYRSVSGGSLFVKADNVSCNYGGVAFTQSRGLARTAYAQKYGRWEIRAKIPQGQGIWPALWLWPLNPDTIPNSNEIDIGEWPGTANATWYMNVHWGPWTPGPPSQSQATMSVDCTGFNLYTLIWTPTSIRWLLNGVDGRTPFTDPTGLSMLTEPLSLHLDMQVGGTAFGGLPGATDGTTPWPVNLEVDSVRIFSL